MQLAGVASSKSCRASTPCGSLAWANLTASVGRLRPDGCSSAVRQARPAGRVCAAGDRRPAGRTVSRPGRACTGGRAISGAACHDRPRPASGVRLSLPRRGGRRHGVLVVPLPVRCVPMPCCGRGNGGVAAGWFSGMRANARPARRAG